LPPEKGNVEEDTQLRDNYEQLRTYALSPVKAPLQPIGLDLWIKKGFWAWWDILIHRKTPPPINTYKARPDNLNISADLLIT